MGKKKKKITEEYYLYEIKNKIKYCSSCEKEIPWGEFSPRANARHKLQNICNTCKKALSTKYYHTRSNPRFNTTRSLNRIKSYGITIEDFFIMLKKQEYSCYICKEPTDEDGMQLSTNRQIHIDHDHNTGKVRGLLCDKCNAGLGHFKDSPSLLKKAIEYLEKNV